MRIVKFKKADQPNFLDEASWVGLTENSVCENYQKGERIFESEAVDNSFMIVLSGKVRLLRRSELGEEIALTRQRGDSIGQSTSHLQVPKLLSAMALEDDTRILKTDMSALYALCMEHMVLMKFVMFDLSHSVQEAARYFYELRELPAEKRVARQLADLWPQYSEIPYNQTQIGEIAGVSRVTVSKTLAELEKLGVIKRAKGRVQVIDLWGLRRWIDQ